MSISVFSKKGCVYCDKAKDLLDEIQVPYAVHLLQPDEEGYAEKRDALFNKYSHRSFPIILVGDVFIGGFTELQNSVATLQFHAIASKIGIDVPIDF
jgi:glutaredoxin